jgi:zinc/manganese transport system permease protein
MTASVWAQPFLWWSLLAGTAIALAAGLVGFVTVLRGQVFAGDALSHVALTGSLAALAFGIDLRLGLYGGCVGFALLLALLGGRQGADDTVIGSVFAWVLGLGALFLSLYAATGSGGSTGGTAGVSVLFGSLLGLSAAQAAADTVVALAVSAALVALARPLIFAALDPAVARARGVPVRALSIAGFVLLGLVAAVATQAVGALLLLGLLAAPAGAAQRLVDRPFAALWASAGIAVASLWIGVVAASTWPAVPASSATVGAAALAYALAWAVSARRAGRGRAAQTAAWRTT